MMHEIPKEHPRNQIENMFFDPENIKQNQQQQNSCSEEQIIPVQLFGIEKCNDQNGAKIIYNSQCGQENLNGGWHPAAQQGNNGKGKGNICSHRYGPAAAVFSVIVETGVDQCGNHHAAHSCNNGKQRISDGGQF